MANLISELVLRTPNGDDFHSAVNPCPTLGIPVRDIQSVRAATSVEVSAYPAATASIQVKYYTNNLILTGAYLVGNQTVSQIITAANA